MQAALGLAALGDGGAYINTFASDTCLLSTGLTMRATSLPCGCSAPFRGDQGYVSLQCDDENSPEEFRWDCNAGCSTCRSKEDEYALPLRFGACASHVFDNASAALFSTPCLGSWTQPKGAFFTTTFVETAGGSVSSCDLNSTQHISCARITCVLRSHYNNARHRCTGRG